MKVTSRFLLAGALAMLASTAAFADDNDRKGPPPCPNFAKVVASDLHLNQVKFETLNECSARSQLGGTATLTLTPCTATPQPPVVLHVMVQINAVGLLSTCGDGSIEGNIMMVDQASNQVINGAISGFGDADGLVIVINGVASKGPDKKGKDTRPVQSRLRGVLTGKLVPGTGTNPPTLENAVFKGTLATPKAPVPNGHGDHN